LSSANDKEEGEKRNKIEKQLSQPLACIKAKSRATLIDLIQSMQV
jgi:hypothetical protein